MTIILMDSPVKRLIGLMGRRTLPEATLYQLAPCDSIHTFWMRVPIDVIFLSRDNVILAIHESVGARRLLSYKGAYAVAEGRAGIAAAYGLLVGERLEA